MLLACATLRPLSRRVGVSSMTNAGVPSWSEGRGRSVAAIQSRRPVPLAVLPPQVRGTALKERTPRLRRSQTGSRHWGSCSHVVGKQDSLPGYLGRPVLAFWRDELQADPAGAVHGHAHVL